MANYEIASLPFVEKFFHFDTMDSTNDFARHLDRFPDTGIVVINADVQTQGRGQRDNSFYSGEGGLYATIVCPLSDIGDHFILNRAVSLAIIESMSAAAAGAPLSVKWPNDILWAGKKACGVLLESVPRSAGHIAVGFGINVNTKATGFPPDLRESATSMSIEVGQQFDVRALLADICVRFQGYRTVLPGEAHGRYRERLHGIGSLIRINDRTGVYEQVLEDGRLCMKADGKCEYFTSGPMYFIT
jgi:BirA family transcriptional regulator, biotin operon repressor / biotin---[acetyl-CoA-carboxylase] ligase